MNNDSTPTPAADLPPISQNANLSDATEAIEPPSLPKDVQTPAQKRAQQQTQKKHDFLTSLMNNLDALVYVELCIVYYMDCSYLRLCIRALSQVVFLTPKPNYIPPLPQQHRPYLGAIFLPNILCILLHIFTARPEAGEALRGYLHGGIIVDIIGQKGPSSKVHLVLLDLLILVLQCVMLTVHVERERVATVLTAFKNPGAAAASAQARAATASTQDMDAEERGVMRDEVTNNGDIELQPLASQDGPSTFSEQVDEERDEERERLLAEPSPTEEEEDDNALDMFYAGQVVLADFHVLQSLRAQWNDYGNATGSALQTVGFSAGIAAASANRRLHIAQQRLQRLQQNM